MGQAAYQMVSEDPELELAGLIDPFTDETDVVGPLSLTAKKMSWVLKQMFGWTFTMPKVAYENTALQLKMALPLLVERLASRLSRSKNWTDLSREKGIWVA